MSGGALAGLRVLILRPERPGDPFAARLVAAGAEVFCLPLLRIEPLPVDPAVLAAAAAADWIFVSRHAVRYGMAALTAAGMDVQAHAIYAVGAATAAALRADWGVNAQFPRQATTESLLELPALQPDRIAGRRLVLFRGSAGRDALRQGLLARHAQAVYCDLYRQRPEARWRDQIRDQLVRPGPLIAVAHSGSLVRALRQLLDSLAEPVPSPACLVPSDRVAAIARQLRLSPLIAASALTGEMEQAIHRWYTPS